MRIHALLLAMSLVVPLAAPASAGPASERIFSTTAMDLIKTGQQVIYTHVREGTAGEDLNPEPNGEIRIRLQTGDDQKREAVVTMGPVGELKPVSVWPASSGNPILPIFLESALRAMARTTGGSTFYIRNRIKDAMGAAEKMDPVTVQVDGSDLKATEIVFPLFQNDKNRDRMGDFKDMTLTFVLSEEMPGDIVRFVAQTPEGAEGVAYHEVIAFSKVVEGQE